MYCVVCGSEISEYEEYCPVCGAKIYHEEVQPDNASVNTENNEYQNAKDMYSESVMPYQPVYSNNGNQNKEQSLNNAVLMDDAVSTENDVKKTKTVTAKRLGKKKLFIIIAACVAILLGTLSFIIIRVSSRKSFSVGGSFYKELSSDDIVFEDGIEAYVKNQIIVKTNDHYNYNDMVKLAQKYDAVIVGYIVVSNEYQLEFNSDISYEELMDIINKIRAKKGIEEANLNYVYFMDDGLKKDMSLVDNDEDSNYFWLGGLKGNLLGKAKTAIIGSEIQNTGLFGIVKSDALYGENIGTDNSYVSIFEYKGKLEEALTEGSKVVDVTADLIPTNKDGIGAEYDALNNSMTDFLTDCNDKFDYIIVKGVNNTDVEKGFLLGIDNQEVYDRIVVCGGVDCDYDDMGNMVACTVLGQESSYIDIYAPGLGQLTDSSTFTDAADVLVNNPSVISAQYTTGTIMWMWELNSSLSPEEIKQILTESHFFSNESDVGVLNGFLAANTANDRRIASVGDSEPKDNNSNLFIHVIAEEEMEFESIDCTLKNQATGESVSFKLDEDGNLVASLAYGEWNLKGLDSFDNEVFDVDITVELSKQLFYVRYKKTKKEWLLSRFSCSNGTHISIDNTYSYDVVNKRIDIASTVSGEDAEYYNVESCINYVGINGIASMFDIPLLYMDGNPCNDYFDNVFVNGKNVESNVVLGENGKAKEYKYEDGYNICILEYDEKGNITCEKIGPINAGCDIINFVYDSVGRVTECTHITDTDSPDIIKYEYNDEGLLYRGVLSSGEECLKYSYENGLLVSGYHYGVSFKCEYQEVSLDTDNTITDNDESAKDWSEIYLDYINQEKLFNLQRQNWDFNFEYIEDGEIKCMPYKVSLIDDDGDGIPELYYWSWQDFKATYHCLEVFSINDSKVIKKSNNSYFQGAWMDGPDTDSIEGDINNFNRFRENEAKGNYIDIKNSMNQPYDYLAGFTNGGDPLNMSDIESYIRNWKP